MTLNRLSLLAGAAAALFVTACSSSSTAAAPPGGSTAPAVQGSTPATAPAAATGSCGVITAAQASAALGQPVKPPVLGKAFVEGGRACVFYGPDAVAAIGPDVPQADTVRVVLVTGPDAKKFFDDYRGKVNAHPVSGLGDQAFYDGYASISVLKGDAYVRIYCGPSGKLGPEEMLAKLALAKM